MPCQSCLKPKTIQTKTGQACSFCHVWMLECEAREWLARIRKQRPRTHAEGIALLGDLIESIAKRRGDAAAQVLRKAILAEQKAGPAHVAANPGK